MISPPALIHHKYLWLNGHHGKFEPYKLTIGSRYYQSLLNTSKTNNLPILQNNTPHFYNFSQKTQTKLFTNERRPYLLISSPVVIKSYE